MKTAILRGPRNFEVEDTSEPTLAPDGAIVQVKAFGICGSELPHYTGGIPADKMEENGGDPVAASKATTGHEYSGIVAEVGANVTNVKPGDRVAAGGYGGYSEYIHVPTAVGCLPLPDGMSFEVAATIEPVGIGAGVVHKAQPAKTDTVVVLGCGMIGQGTLQVLKATGVERVIITDINQNRVDMAKKMGADVAINAAKEDPIAVVNELTDGIGADLVVDAAGEPAVFHQMFEIVRGGGLWQIQSSGNPTDRHTAMKLRGISVDTMSFGGMVAFVGTYEEPVNDFIPNVIYRKAIKAVGNWGGMMRPAYDWMRDGTIRTDELITHQYPLADINEAFEMQLTRNESIKVIVHP
jgi:threonine dehydrogenase-like Zn-dependent dehydrogenase